MKTESGQFFFIPHMRDEKSFSFFILLCILFIPFPFHLLNVQSAITDFVFGGLIDFVSTTIFKVRLSDTRAHSDSVSMYILVLLLIILSVVIALLLEKRSVWKKHKTASLTIIYKLGYYYLLIILLKYGLDKVFKTQFYLPEPNTLFTPVGQVDKDLLYWTAIGTSRAYNICIGLVEVLAAFMLLFKRTRIGGILLAIISLVQVVIVNFSFDISVKLYSLFLLLLSLYLATPWYRRLYGFLFTQKEIPALPINESIGIKKHSFLTAFAKSAIIGLIFVEAFYPFLKTGNFNDDVAPRPYLHGAYEVQHVIAGKDTLARTDYPYKRFFIHRSGYMIFQDREDQMQDFRLVYDTITHLLVLDDYQLKSTVLGYRYSMTDSILTLQFVRDSKNHILTGKAVNWKNLPLLRKSFHWFVDEAE